MKLPNFTRPLYGAGEYNVKNFFFFCTLRYLPFGFNPRNFANIWQIKWNWIKSMMFETVWIHFLSDVFGLLSFRNFTTITTWCNDFFSLHSSERPVSVEGMAVKNLSLSPLATHQFSDLAFFISFFRCLFQKPQKSMNRYEKQKRKFDEKKKLLNQGSQRAVGISIEGRKMALWCLNLRLFCTGYWEWPVIKRSHSKERLIKWFFPHFVYKYQQKWPRRRDVLTDKKTVMVRSCWNAFYQRCCVLWLPLDENQANEWHFIDNKPR